MTQQRDDVAPVVEHRSSRLRIATAIAVVILLAAVIIIAVNRGSSRRHHAQPTTSPAPGRVATMPPLNPLVLGILNATGDPQWRTTELGQVSTNYCVNYLHNIYIPQQCDYVPVRSNNTQALYVSVIGQYFPSPSQAYEMYKTEISISPTPLPNIGDHAAFGGATQTEQAPVAPSQRITLTGTNVQFVYGKTLFDVWYCGAHYITAPDGALTNVKGFSYDEALGEAKSLAQRIIAKLPLTS